MSWNYRIVKYRGQKGYGLHEVYYDKEGEPWGMTKRPASFECELDEGAAGIRGSLLLARVDSINRPVLEQPRKWPGKAP